MMVPIIELIERQTREYAEEIDRTIMRAVTDVGVQVDQERLLQALNDARQFWYEGYNAALREQEQSRWISVKERLPESGVHVLAAVKLDGAYCHGLYVCDAFYAARYSHAISEYSDEAACEYSEEDDEYFLEEGWYEVIKNWDDYNSITINDTVTHWMPLPEPPKEGAEG